MSPIARERRGIALPLVLWAMVIGSVLLTVVVFLILQEQRAGQAGRRLVHTFTRAEAGLAEMLDGWTPGTLNRALPGNLDSLGVVGSDTAVDEESPAIRRLNQGLYLMAVRVRDGATEARLGRLVRVRPEQLAVPAALTSGDEVRLGGVAIISGEDETPTVSTECPPPDSAVAGVAAPAILTTDAPVITGSPPTVTRQHADSGLDPDALEAFQDFVSQATLDLRGGSWETGPATVGTVCSVEVPGNWGDPDNSSGPCAAYMPIIHVGGDLELLPGRGQGVLLVDGALKLHGPYRFAGLLMVRGRLEVIPGDTVKLRGAVFAGGAGLEATPPAVLSITYSKCLLSKALLSSGRLIPLRSRSWKALF